MHNLINNQNSAVIINNTAKSKTKVMQSFSQAISLFSFLLLAAMLMFSSVPQARAAAAGFSEFYIPADEGNLLSVLEELGSGIQDGPMTVVIGATAWEGNTVLYYDHWEDGYEIDIANPDNDYDEKVSLLNSGDSQTFESTSVTPAPGVDESSQCGVDRTCAYDGRDRIVTVGGAVTLSRSGWDEDTGTLQAVAWEIYPVSPLLTTYIMPFGENLAGLDDFDRVYALIQATEDDVEVQINYDGNPGYDDLSCNSQWEAGTPTTIITLDQGEVFLLDRNGACLPAITTLNSGTRIDASAPIQVQYIIGDEGTNYEIRGLSAFPRGFWSKEYYAPEPGHTNGKGTDIYLYNPHSTTLTVNWATSSASGSVDIPQKSTISLAGAGGGISVPLDSAVYLSADDVFWGVSSIDAEGRTYDWAYSLVPVELLAQEQFIAWAPGSTTPLAAVDHSGIFLTPTLENTTFYIDRDNNGTVDEEFTLGRLETRYVWDPVDGDMSDAHIWATAPYAAAYGQNPDTANGGAPAIDVGYTMLPSLDSIRVLNLAKTTNPTMVAPTDGLTTDYTITVDSFAYPVDVLNVNDFLPAGWDYVVNTAIITYADLSTAQLEPDIATDVATNIDTLSWNDILQNQLAQNQTITIMFSAEVDNTEVTGGFSVGDVTRNDAEATATRVVEGVAQIFTSSDFAFNSFGRLTISKESNVLPATPLSPGDTFTYTVNVSNPAGATYNNVAIYDPMPLGISFVSGSVVYPVAAGAGTYADDFSGTNYTNSSGTANWSSETWNEINDGASSPSAGNIQIDTGNNRLVFDRIGGLTSYSIERTVDLTGKTNRTLAFNYSEAGGLEDSDTMVVTVNGTQILSTSNDFGSGSYNSGATDLEDIITSSGSSIVTILFTATNFGGDGEEWRLNDITFGFDQAAGTGTAVLSLAPNLISSSDGYDLAAGESMTLTFDVTVDDLLAYGIDTITNTASATADELPVPISDDATNIVNNPGAGSATVGQRVWFDTDGNGEDNVGEPGLANVEVTLRDDFGTPIAVTTTDANGYYSFTGIPAGNDYYVQVTGGLPSGLTLSTTAGPVANSTPRFNLTDGQNYTDANLGYSSSAGTATIGDLVWSDANGNGIRDAGEPGLAGVAIELWQDDGDGVFDPGLDTPITTTTSGAGGNYLFSGVTASGTEDYFVYVNPSLGPVSGYTSTTSTNFLISDVASGDVQLNADFGFQPSGGGGTTAYSISDRIWFDVNADGDDENGAESGLAGVTVNLLDASLNVIATTTTDATGAFAFSGVPNGNYTIDVTDTGNVLVDYYGTTTSAISGDKAVTVFNAPVSAVSFGYNVTRSIGDTVFNDLNGDGDQDAGEPGISGVVVELDDGSCTLSSPPTAGTCPVLTTDANGTYLFSGLTDGSYTVVIYGNQASLSGFTLTTADDGGTGTQQTRNAVITGGSSVLDIDYGYQAGGGTSNDIDGTLWSDANQDGVIDGTEALLENVTVELVNSSGTTIATTTTNASGVYTFTGWPNADYAVRVTDTDSILNGYTQTYEVDSGLCSGSSCDGSSAADTTSGPVSGLNFGYYIEIITTLVTLTDFQAYQSAEGVVVEWQTGFEQGTLGFWLERKDKDSGKFTRINDEMLPALALQGQQQGGTYQYTDAKAKVGKKYRYRLIEEEVWGSSKKYGPFKVQVTEARRDDAAVKTNGLQRAGKNFKQRARKLQRKIDRQTMKAARKAKRKANRKSPRRFDGVTMAVRKTGMVHVDATQLAAEMAKDVSEVESLIANGQLKLTNRGKAVSWQADADNSGLIFFGESIDSLYTLDNVYQLREGKGNQLRSKKGAANSRADSDRFLHTEIVEKDVFAATVAAKDPEVDYWFEGGLLAGNASLSRRAFDLPLEDIIAGSEITVELSGATEGLHEVEVYLNDMLIGSGSWSGMKAHSLTMSLSGQLDPSGSNTLELVLGGDDRNVIYYNRSIVTYTRAARAVENQLIMTAEQRGNIRIEGFTDDSIRVWDITNPRRPVSLSVLETGPDSGAEHQVRFAAKSGKRYLAVADSAQVSVAAVALQSPDWSGRAEHLVISTEELSFSAQALVDYRNSMGISSQLILIEDIYQRYNHGIANPYAIRTFLEKFAKRRGTRYVVFAGSASFDYRDIMQAGDNFVPTLMTPTPQGLYGCDACLGDLDGDNYAEFIISRIPATDDTGLLAYIEKLRAYESGNSPAAALLLADKNDPRAGAFKDDSKSLVELFPDNYLISNVYLDDYTDSEDVTDMNQARADLFSALDSGAGHVNYIGHGGLGRFAKLGLLTTSDFPQMSNVETPIVTALTCSVNRYEYPGFPSLGEELVMDADGGAIAIWAPSGESYNTPAVKMNNALLEIIYQHGQTVVGEAIDEALRNTPDVPEYMLRIYNLIGDAAVRVQ